MENNQSKNPKKPHKTVYILPNLFTTASIFLAFLSLIYTTKGAYEFSAFLIIIGAIFDSLDGKVARLTNTTSEFGVQYDSLADIITFGVAPAFLLFSWKLLHYEQIGLIISFLYITCGALRLARFNISTATGSKMFFTGLPIPMAAVTIATLVFFDNYLQKTIAFFLPTLLFPIITLLLSLLMISKVQYFSFKEFRLLQEKPFFTLVLILLVMVSLALQPSLLSFVFIALYIIIGLLYTFLYLPLFSKKIKEKTS